MKVGLCQVRLGVNSAREPIFLDIKDVSSEIWVLALASGKAERRTGNGSHFLILP